MRSEGRLDSALILSLRHGGLAKDEHVLPGWKWVLRWHESRNRLHYIETAFYLPTIGRTVLRNSSNLPKRFVARSGDPPSPPIPDEMGPGVRHAKPSRVILEFHFDDVSMYESALA